MRNAAERFFWTYPDHPPDLGMASESPPARASSTGMHASPLNRPQVVVWRQPPSQRGLGGPAVGGDAGRGGHPPRAGRRRGGPEEVWIRLHLDGQSTL